MINKYKLKINVIISSTLKYLSFKISNRYPYIKYLPRYFRTEFIGRNGIDYQQKY